MPPLPKMNTPGALLFYALGLALIASIIWAACCFDRAIRDDKKGRRDREA